MLVGVGTHCFLCDDRGHWERTRRSVFSKGRWPWLFPRDLSCTRVTWGQHCPLATCTKAHGYACSPVLHRNLDLGSGWARKTNVAMWRVSLLLWHIDHSGLWSLATKMAQRRGKEAISGALGGGAWGGRLGGLEGLGFRKQQWWTARKWRAESRGPLRPRGHYRGLWE